MSSARSVTISLLGLVAFGAACSEAATIDVPEGCQPIGAGADCRLPYPSDFFRRPGAAGFEVRLDAAAKLRADDGTTAELGDSIPIDGFSRWPLIVATFPKPAAPDKLVRLFDPPAQSTDPATSATLLIRADTGAFVPHFADLDALEGDGQRNALVLHPITPLEADTRYVVLVAGMKSVDGQLLPAPEGFQQLRDGLEFDGYERFEDDVFVVAAAAGVPKKDLQLAWDFTTGTDDFVTRDMRIGREMILAAIAAAPVVVVIEDVEEDPPDEGKALVWREIHGHITIPLIVDDPDRGARLLRDGDGNVTLAGEAELPFIAMIPKSLQGTTEPGVALGYGHGFFGDRREVVKGPPQRIATEVGAVLFGIDWQGMSMRDATTIIEQLVGAPSHAMDFTDRVHQGVLNWVVMTSAIQNSMADLPAFRRADDTPVFDPTRVALLGISQGHILGGVAGAVNPDFDRVALNVGGAGLTHMMYRSKPFEPFLELLALAMSDPLVRLTFVSTMQRRLDRIDPATYGPLMIDEPLDGTAPDRRVLMQVGVADTSVPDYAAHLHARRLGATLLTPSPIDVYGLEPFTEGDRAAMTVFDFGVDRAFMLDHAPPPGTNEVHNGVRELPAALAQLKRFLAPGGVITHPCEGACDPQ